MHLKYFVHISIKFEELIKYIGPTIYRKIIFYPLILENIFYQLIIENTFCQLKTKYIYIYFISYKKYQLILENVLKSRKVHNTFY